MDFSIAHCNFQLRDTESDMDAFFVEDLARKIGKKIYIKDFDTAGYINTNKVSLQMAARELRYRWFEELMQINKIKTLVTAHQADDNLETFIINLSRGTGIKGLMGIPAKTSNISRPLLIFSKAQIMQFAEIKNISWREDQSNRETRYLRNNSTTPQDCNALLITSTEATVITAGCENPSNACSAGTMPV